MSPQRDGAAWSPRWEVGARFRQARLQARSCRLVGPQCRSVGSEEEEAVGPEKRGSELGQRARLGRGAAHVRPRGWVTGPFTPPWKVRAVSTREGAQRVCPPCGEPGPSASLSGPGLVPA